VSEVAFLFCAIAWLCLGTVPLVVEWSRRPLDRMHDLPLLGGMLLLGPLGLFMWVVSLFNVDAE
jgi:hypothetical protein